MLCAACRQAVSDSIEYYDWKDRYTEEQHERALSLLSERDEIECVLNSYEDGQIILHTPYVSSDLVADYCEHFGFVIKSFGPRWMQDGVFPCETSHGDIFEIVLEYNSSCDPPIPTSVIFENECIDRLDGNDKQF